MKKITFDELLQISGGEAVRTFPDPLTGIASLELAGSGDISFYGNSKYRQALQRSRASVVLVPADHPDDGSGPVLVRTANPTESFNRVMKRFIVERSRPLPGIHPAAFVDPSAEIDPGASVGPGAVVGPRCRVGAGCEIQANVSLGEAAIVGEDCLLYANVSVYHGCVLGNRVILHSGVVVGSDGFGYERMDGRHLKMDQLGIVEIGDDVEIGANSSVDRARFGKTIIGEGTKIDNLVQIGHNSRIGRHCVIAAQSGIAGSARIGDHVVIAGQCGVDGHIEVGSGAVLASRTGVTKTVEGNRQYMGFPVMPAREGRRVLAAYRSLGKIVERLRRLERRVNAGDEG